MARALLPRQAHARGVVRDERVVPAEEVRDQEVDARLRLARIARAVEAPRVALPHEVTHDAIAHVDRVGVCDLIGAPRLARGVLRRGAEVDGALDARRDRELRELRRCRRDDRRRRARARRGIDEGEEAVLRRGERRPHLSAEDLALDDRQT